MNGFPNEWYYAIFSQNILKMREYHADTHSHRFIFVSDSTEEFWGNLSVGDNGRRPVLLVG